MKKSLILKILYLFLMLIVVAGASVFATNTYLASQISYGSTNVEAALNDLYNKQKNNKSQNINGYYQFTTGNHGFSTVTGEVEYNSLGIIAKSYNDNGYCTIEKILEAPIVLKDKFELSSQLFIDNSNSKYGGFINIHLYQTSDNNYVEICNLRISDAWSGSTQVGYGCKFNSTEISLRKFIYKCLDKCKSWWKIFYNRRWK